jgi:hypothetical protein
MQAGWGERDRRQAAGARERRAPRQPMLARLCLWQLHGDLRTVVGSAFGALQEGCILPL